MPVSRGRNIHICQAVGTRHRAYGRLQGGCAVQSRQHGGLAAAPLACLCSEVILSQHCVVPEAGLRRHHGTAEPLFACRGGGICGLHGNSSHRCQQQRQA